ncbi:MAG: hypothetical protein J3K34DRAFT_103530 [Monoraphidium minutum]|nr:MAG: hypothetical protein J3K34DRAFT_103530 [Monoraphidium minutum]
MEQQPSIGLNFHTRAECPPTHTHRGGHDYSYASALSQAARPLCPRSPPPTSLAPPAPRPRGALTTLRVPFQRAHPPAPGGATRRPRAPTAARRARALSAGARPAHAPAARGRGGCVGRPHCLHLAGPLSPARPGPAAHPCTTHARTGRGARRPACRPGLSPLAPCFSLPPAPIPGAPANALPAHPSALPRRPKLTRFLSAAGPPPASQLQPARPAARAHARAAGPPRDRLFNALPPFLLHCVSTPRFSILCRLLNALFFNAVLFNALPQLAPPLPCPSIALRNPASPPLIGAHRAATASRSCAGAALPPLLCSRGPPAPRGLAPGAAAAAGALHAPPPPPRLGRGPRSH